MKNRKSVFTVTVLGLAFALMPGTEAARQLEGGPVHQSSIARDSASSKAGAQLGMPENILPVASISFAPVGLTFGQTARLNLVNMTYECITLAAASSTRTALRLPNP